MDIFFGIIITVLSVIGLKTVCGSIYDILLSGTKQWNARIIINVIPTKHTPAEQLIDTLNYIRIKYLPRAEICILCGNINKDDEQADSVAYDKSTEVTV